MLILGDRLCQLIIILLLLHIHKRQQFSVLPDGFEIAEQLMRLGSRCKICFECSLVIDLRRLCKICVVYAGSILFSFAL